MPICEIGAKFSFGSLTDVNPREVFEVRLDTKLTIWSVALISKIHGTASWVEVKQREVPKRFVINYKKNLLMSLGLHINYLNLEEEKK